MNYLLFCKSKAVCKAVQKFKN